MNLESFGLDTNTILIWCGLGLGSGIIAKYLLPGKDKGGLISTTVVGIVGAFVGGLLANHFGLISQVGGISVLSVITAVAGSIIVLIAFRILRLLI